MRLWIDDVRMPPDESWLWIRTANAAKKNIKEYDERHNLKDDYILISLGCDAGDFASEGNDCIEILNWLEEYGCVDETYEFHVHSINPVCRENMRRIIMKNNWYLWE